MPRQSYLCLLGISQYLSTNGVVSTKKSCTEERHLVSVNDVRRLLLTVNDLLQCHR
eukprot:Gb_22786 [translate_table: standard]